MERAVFVYTTYPAIVEAERAGRALVERRLCACVNILPGMVSYYWWQGAIERGDEVVMIIKTRASLAEAVRAAVKEMHSYSTPAVLVIPIENVDPDYHAWIVAETERGMLATRIDRSALGRLAGINAHALREAAPSLLPLFRGRRRRDRLAAQLDGFCEGGRASSLPLKGPRDEWGSASRGTIKASAKSAFADQRKPNTSPCRRSRP